MNENGDLLDSYGEKEVVLLHASDVLLSKEMDETEFVDDTVALWNVVYKIKKVLKSKRRVIIPGDFTS